MNQKRLLLFPRLTWSVPPRASPSASSSHRAGGLSRAAVERAVIKLEGQVELILFPHGASSQHLDWRQVPICLGA